MLSYLEPACPRVFFCMNHGGVYSCDEVGEVSAEKAEPLAAVKNSPLPIGVLSEVVSPTVLSKKIYSPGLIL